MRKFAILIIALPIAALLSACGGAPAGTAPVNIKAVLERTVATLDKFDAYLRRYEYKSVDDAMFHQFSETIERELNLAPRIHSTLITTQLRKDASITGYGDLNGNGKPDAKEPKLFTIELDPDNDRVIVTSAAHGEATGHAMSRSRGFFAGVFIGALSDRQRQAGIRPGFFNKRSVASAPVAKPRMAKAGAGANAHSRARSGGLRGGK